MTQHDRYNARPCPVSGIPACPHALVAATTKNPTKLLQVEQTLLHSTSLGKPKVATPAKLKTMSVTMPESPGDRTRRGGERVEKC